MLVWPVFVGFVIWGAVVVRRTIREVEGPNADGGPGAIVFGIAFFAVAALVPGVLLLLADRSQPGNTSGSSSAQMPTPLR